MYNQYYTTLTSKEVHEGRLSETVDLKPIQSERISFPDFRSSTGYVNVFLNCYYVPQIPYHYFKTQPYLAYSYYTGSITEKKNILKKLDQIAKRKKHIHIVLYFKPKIMLENLFQNSLHF